MNVRTRFAPSPTGFLHVGGVRTALFAWLLAQQGKKDGEGRFILRIEDTDKAREVQGSEDHIKESLKWLGLDWDEDPVRQSERLDIYKKYAHQLIETGRAYADPYTQQQLEQFRQKAKDDKRPFLFRDHRPENPPSWDGSKPLRFRSEPKAYNWHDEVMGDLSTGPEAVDDFILIKSDGYPTYNFAHTVDDSEMKITHVIRSQEFLSSVPKFLNLYEALDIDRPKLATLPYVLGPDGKKKLSKRDGAKDILDYRSEGYLPEALMSFLATLGWNDGTTQEIYTREELIEKFSLARVQKSGAKFDEERLKWINGKLIREMPLDQFVETANEYLPPAAKDAALNYRREVLRLVQEKVRTLSEIPELTDFFFREDYLFDKNLLTSAAANLGDPKKVLETVKQELADSDFSPEDLQARLRSLVGKLDTQPKDLFGLIRVAVTGKTVAPGLWELLAVLGHDKSLAQLDRAVALLDSQA